MQLNDELAPKVPEKFPEPLERGVILKRCRLAVEGTIILPEHSETPTNYGWVMAASEDCLGELKVGMKVLFNSKANAFLMHKEETYLTVHENDIYSEIETITHENGVKEDILKPFNKSVLIIKGQKELKMASGIILPDNQKIINYGQVIGVGQNVNKKIKVGQKVMFNIYSDFCFPFNGKTINSMYECDVLVIMDHNTMAGIENLPVDRRADIDIDKLPEAEPKEIIKGTKFHGLDNIGK
jgi:co-chaperonin GroES (HSP10)